MLARVEQTYSIVKGTIFRVTFLADLREKLPSGVALDPIRSFQAIARVRQG